ncbi:UDP-N-acetylenolpyruvoylglucosamine reductase [Candidatus Parcubacteria bacterium 4484_255]|nr:MAG: UDP-N-acetylenolpyruvoylglucosamine reductase [Candidatus Parcubacteria bacterium 4484_255]
MDLVIREVIRENVRISPLTTFRIGGLAKYFFEAQNKKELKKVINWAQKQNIPYFILGGGSNILVSDKGFDGLLIKVPAKDIKVKKGRGALRIVKAEAGVLLSKLIAFSVKRGLSGLEYFIGIPGTVGGAIYGNAGWPRNQKSIGDVMVGATLLMPNGQITKKRADWFKFVYRSSKLKNFGSKKIIILSAEFQLRAGDKNEILQTQEEILSVRKRGIPKGYSCGCVFKNIEIKKNHSSFFRFADQLPLAFIKRGSISAGWLIDQCGLRGYKIGGAQISKQHANFIINVDKAKACDVQSLIEIVQRQVKKKFDINLSLEIEYLL